MKKSRQKNENDIQDLPALHRNETVDLSVKARSKTKLTIQGFFNQDKDTKDTTQENGLKLKKQTSSPGVVKNTTDLISLFEGNNGSDTNNIDNDNYKKTKEDNTNNYVKEDKFNIDNDRYKKQHPPKEFNIETNSIDKDKYKKTFNFTREEDTQSYVDPNSIEKDKYKKTFTREEDTNTYIDNDRYKKPLPLPTEFNIDTNSIDKDRYKKTFTFMGTETNILDDDRYKKPLPLPKENNDIQLKSEIQQNRFKPVSRKERYVSMFEKDRNQNDQFNNITHNTYRPPPPT